MSDQIRRRQRGSGGRTSEAASAPRGSSSSASAVPSAAELASSGCSDGGFAFLSPSEVTRSARSSRSARCSGDAPGSVAGFMPSRETRENVFREVPLFLSKNHSFFQARKKRFGIQNKNIFPPPERPKKAAQRNPLPNTPGFHRREARTSVLPLASSSTRTSPAPILPHACLTPSYTTFVRKVMDIFLP